MEIRDWSKLVKAYLNNFNLIDDYIRLNEFPANKRDSFILGLIESNRNIEIFVKQISTNVWAKNFKFIKSLFVEYLD